jgi:hypothetical protein
MNEENDLWKVVVWIGALALVLLTTVHPHHYYLPISWVMSGSQVRL